MSFLFQQEDLERIQLVKVSAEQIWTSATDFSQLAYYPKYGIGLMHHPDYPDDPMMRYNYGYLVSGIVDCGPNVSEYGRLTVEEDIFYGVSAITWKVRSSSDRLEWTKWYEDFNKCPVKQFVQFKFELFLTEGAP